MAVMLPRLLGAVVGLVVAGMVTASPSMAITVQVLAIELAVFDMLDPADSLNLGGGYWDTARTSVTGTSPGKWTSPWEGDPDFATTKYWTVGSSSPENLPSPAILRFDVGQTFMSFLWGSIGSSNSLSFYDFGGNLIATVGGASIDPGGFPGGALVSFSLDQQFFRIDFQATQNAFEFSNIYTPAIPLPAAFPLFATAIAGLGLLGWRRKRKASV